MYAFFEPNLRTPISGLPCTNRSDMISKVLTEVTRIRELCNPPELGSFVYYSRYLSAPRKNVTQVYGFTETG
jgi:hypothetical protein